MPLTVMIDLDDTLLVNPMKGFMSAYLELLSKHLAPFVPPQKMIPQLLTATDSMIANDRPCRTLKEIFDQHFYPALGLDQGKLMGKIDQFYNDVFPTLQKITSPIPDAVALVEHAFSQGYQVVIATNPLFPEAAIMHRLEWAGLSPKDYPFCLVTSYEKMHFAKPNSAYYAEILGQLGWFDQPACMIGNNLEDDLRPAARLGIAGFLVAENNNHQSDFATGTLRQAITWLDRIAAEFITPEYQTANSILPVLKSTPAAISTMTFSISITDWQRKLTPSEWSILEIVSHLSDVEKEINFPRVRQFEKEDKPFISGVDSDKWAEERHYNEKYSPAVLKNFCASRSKLIDVLSTMKPDDWMKPARHSIFGPTNLAELMSFVASHDRDHTRQIETAISRL